MLTHHAAARYQLQDNTFLTEIEGETVLLQLEAGIYYGLDEMGTSIWKRLEQGQSVDDVVAALLDEYDVSEDQLRQDVEQLVEELLRESLIKQQ